MDAGGLDGEDGVGGGCHRGIFGVREVVEVFQWMWERRTWELGRELRDEMLDRQHWRCGMDVCICVCRSCEGTSKDCHSGHADVSRYGWKREKRAR